MLGTRHITLPFKRSSSRYKTERYMVSSTPGTRHGSAADRAVQNAAESESGPEIGRFRGLPRLRRLPGFQLRGPIGEAWLSQRVEPAPPSPNVHWPTRGRVPIVSSTRMRPVWKSTPAVIAAIGAPGHFVPPFAAARTIASMPARTASGSNDHASTISASSGSI